MAKQGLRDSDISTRYPVARRAALGTIGGSLVGVLTLSVGGRSSWADETDVATAVDPVADTDPLVGGDPSDNDVTQLGDTRFTDCDRDIANDFYPNGTVDSDTTIRLADPIGKGSGREAKQSPAVSGDARLVAVRKPGCDTDAS